MQMISVRLDNRVASFPLPTQSQHKNGIDLSYVTIQCYVPSRSSSDNQLPLVAVDRSSDQWIKLEYRDSLNDLIYARWNIINVMVSKMIKNPIEVITDLWGQLDSRHA